MKNANDQSRANPDAGRISECAGAARSARRVRRGSVIVLAVGVLAILAIVAVSYTVAVRNDRQGAQTYEAASVTSGMQVVVADKIGEVLGADLFGNKRVTRDIPQFIDSGGDPTSPNTPGAIRLWPSMFEDGEYSDVPWVDGDDRTNTFITSFPGQPFTGNPGAVLIPGTFFGVAPQHDDAWLASSEPVASGGGPNDRWDTWPQITNLRSMYRLAPNPANPSAKVWVREDGRFADLGRFFLSDRALATSKPDPDADLTDFEDDAPGPYISGAGLGRSQRVFDFQINGMGNNEAAGGVPAEYYAGGANPNPNRAFPYEPIDERYWADADGDLRPDSRWQTLDALGTLGGLRWVVACRIIDNSGQINVNTALESGINNSPGPFSTFSPRLPTETPALTITSLLGGVSLAEPDRNRFVRTAGGMTPADVDLFRLLRTADRADRDLTTFGAWRDGGSQGPRNLMRVDEFDPMTSDPARPAWRRHVDDSLHLTDLVTEMRLAGDPSLQPRYPFAGGGAPQSTTLEWRYTASERSEAYHAFGVAPFERESFARAYPLADELDLKTYWGVNNDRMLSGVERSFDAEYLPAQARTHANLNDPPGSPVANVGPLRSANPLRAERSFQPVAGTGGDFPRPTVEDLRDDVRRHLTTYSGVADFSPVPVLNTALENGRLAYADRPFNRKIRLLDFPVNTLGSGNEALAREQRKFDLIRRSYEAFAWALAPLATGASVTDKPIMPPLQPTDVGLNAPTADKHYGGGPGGPATKIGMDGGVDMGASYALLRAASLAVNLADAMDNDFPAAVATDPTIERPTVVRLFNVVQTDPTRAPASAPDTPGVIELGVRFGHGDVGINGAPSPTLLPPRYVGQSGSGVTLIGLDRQPFLRAATVFAAYENVGAEGQTLNVADPTSEDRPLEIDPTNPAHQLGSILAVEVANPWPTDIDVTGFRVAMATDAGWCEFELDGGGASGNQIVAAGRSALYFVSVTSTAGQALWDPVEDAWEAEVLVAGGATALPPRKVSGTLIMRDPATGAELTGVLDPVPFQNFTSGGSRPGVVMLFTPPATGPALLIDRMTTDDAADFPAMPPGVVQVPAPPGLPVGQRWQGRIAAAGSIRRANDVPTTEGAGFPAYIVERPTENLVDRYTAPLANGWYLSWQSPGTDPGAPALLSGIAVGYVDPKSHYGQRDDAPAYMPSVQLFVPNGPLVSPSELAMISAFTHNFVHTTNAPLSIVETMLAANATLTGEGAWQTIGEQLGLGAHLSYDSAAMPSATPPPTNRNPYLGVLDPTRFTLSSLPPPGGPDGLGVLGGPSGQARLPDSLAIPLAARVFDCFEALDIPTGLAQGRVNVNTAPVRALRMLPWMSPWYQVKNNASTAVGFPFDGDLSDASANPGPIVERRDRAFALADYRDAGLDNILPSAASRFSATTANRDGLSRQGQTHLAGLRGVGIRANARPQPGLVGAGEISLIARWNTDFNGVTAPGDVAAFSGGATGYSTFAELGLADPNMGGMRFNSGQPTTPTPTAGVVPTDNLLDLRPNAGADLGAGLRAFDPKDDAEERLAVFRPLANVVSTRSDVFTAWFVIRGYDPRRIAAVEIPNGTDDFRVRESLNQLRPTHESRWLAVFDRSNVKSPVDRPRLLMLTELPVR